LALFASVLSLFLTQCARFDGPLTPPFETPAPAPGQTEDPSRRGDPVPPDQADATATQPSLTSVEGITVTVSDDDRVLGYPDQRKIVSDSQGRLFVAFRRQFRVNGSSQYHIFVARSTDLGETWSVLNDARPIENTGRFTQRVPAIAIDANDGLHVVWYGTDELNSGANQRQIKYARSLDGGETWSDWQNIGEVAGYAEPQRLWQEHPVITAQGDALHVVWQGRDADAKNRSQVRYVRSDDRGVTWSTPAIVQPVDKGGRSRPTLIAAPDNKRLYVLAYGDNDGRQNVMMTYSDDGKTWTDWSQIAASENDQRHVTAVLDDGGRLHVAWREGGPGLRTFIRYARFVRDRWRPAVVVHAAPARFQFFPSIAVSGDGRVVLAWIETTGLSGYPEEEFRVGELRWAVTRATADEWTEGAALTLDQPVNFVSLAHNHVAANRIDVVWSRPLGDKQTAIRYGALLLR
jgi:hypothetical protein